MKQIVRLAAAAVLAVASLFTLATAQPAQRVLIEEFTGAWCQYCPNGAVAIDELAQLYPDDVTVVAIHNGDGMVINPEDTDLQPYKGGYPSGALNRVYTGIYPTNWAQYIPNMIRNPAVVDVSLSKVTYNSINRSLSVTVKADFFTAMSGDFRFNLYIVEDSVVGSGPAYDQVNAFNNQQGHPFYGKGSPIKGYAHRHVVRKMMGSSWGTAGSIPATVSAGQSVTYTYTLSLNSAWKTDRIHLVGVVQQYNQNTSQRQILNSVEERLTVRSVKPGLVVPPTPYLTAKLGVTKEQEIKISNPHTAPITVDIAIDDAKSVNPGGWEVSVTPESATIPANGTVTAKISFQVPADASPALANFIVSATPRQIAGIDPKTNSTSVYCLNENSKYAYISGLVPVFNGVDKYATAFMNDAELQKGLIQLQFNEQVLAAYQSNFVLFYLPIHGGYFDQQNYQSAKIGLPIAAAPGVNFPNFAKQISGWLSAGKRVFVSAPHSLWWALDQSAASAQGKNNDAIALFSNTLGVSLSDAKARFTETQSGNNISVTIDKFNIRGVTDDVVGDQLASLGNPSTPGSGHSFWTDIMKLQTGSKSIPCFFSDEKPANIVGVRYEKDKAKLVYLTFGIEALNGGAPNDFMAKITEYLIGDLKPKLPEISSSSDVIDYGSIEVNQSQEKTIDVMNIGAAPLTVSTIEVAGIDDKNFTITDGATVPFTLDANEKRTLKVKFAPDAEKDFLASVVVTSNSGNEENNTYTMDLRGKGKVTASAKSVLTASSEKLDFGQVSESKELSVVLTNTGTKEMTVKSIEFVGGENAKFATKGFKPNTFIGTATANKKLPVTIVFTPGGSGLFGTKMIVKSEFAGGGTDEFTIDAVGEGIATGVNEDGAVSGIILTASAQPNPTATVSSISYTVGGNTPQTVAINVVDMTGREMLNLGSNTMSPGKYNASIDAAKLPAGAYYVVLRCAAETITLPFTIVR